MASRFRQTHNRRSKDSAALKAKTKRRFRLRTLLNRLILLHHSPRGLSKYLLSLVPKQESPATTSIVVAILSIQGADGTTIEPSKQTTLQHVTCWDFDITGILPLGKSSAKVVITSMPLQLLKERIRRRKINFETKCPIIATKVLHWGVEFGQQDLVQRMLESGARVDSVDEEGQTPLQIAMRQGSHRIAFMTRLEEHKELFMLLLTAGANIDITDDNGNTLLHHIIERELDKHFQLLLKQGAIVNAINDNGLTPLSIAAGLARFDMVESLLRHGGDVNLATGGQHALFLAPRSDALRKGKEEDRHKVAMLLISHGADINCRDSKTGFTVLEKTLRHSMAPLALELIRRGADISRTVKGSSLLHLAIAMKTTETLCLEVVNALFNKNYNVDAQPLDRDNKSPLHLSAQANFCCLSKHLISKGFLSDASDKFQNVPLDHAVAKRNVELVKILLSASSYKMKTILKQLRKAISDKKVSLDIVKLLLKDKTFDSDPKQVSVCSNILNTSITKGHVELVWLLRCHGFKYSQDSLVEAL